MEHACKEATDVPIFPYLTENEQVQGARLARSRAVSSLQSARGRPV